MKILLSKEKIESLRKELKIVQKRNYEGLRQAGKDIAYSLKDAAVSNTARAHFEAKGRKISEILKNTEELPSIVKSDKAVLGTWVTVKNEDLEEMRYRLVHPIEADPDKNLLSIESPLGKSLLGAKVGDFIGFTAERKFEVKALD